MKRSYVLAAVLLTAALVAVRMFWSSTPAPSAPEPATASKPAVARETDMPLAPAPAGVEAAASVRVHGEVTSTHGDRLPDVRVSATAGRAAEAVTDASGAYELRLEPIGGEVPALRFSAGGYQDAEARVEPTGVAAGEARLDVRLEPRSGTVISGTLSTEAGSAIAGETIHVTSVDSGAVYAAASGVGGRFSVRGVEPGRASIAVRQPELYRDVRKLLEFGEDGVSIDIVLAELTTLRLSGRLVDTQGRPIPDLALSVVSGQAMRRTLQTRSDEEGQFVLDDVPSGFLSFSTPPPEGLVISGVALGPDPGGVVLLRADWRDGELRGRVVDGVGRPLPGAQVELLWLYVGEGASSRSARSTVSDARGGFAFRRLGGGIHHLEVR